LTHLPAGRVARGVRGAVSAGHPVATLAGTRMLELGGTAIDACVAMAAASWVVMPEMCGPGGDMFALWREPGGEVVAINGASCAAAGYNAGSNIQSRAALALLPGLPAAVTAILRAGCRLELARLFEPAIAIARSGFVVGEGMGRELRALTPGPFLTSLVHAHGGMRPETGKRFRLPGLAESLENWAASGDPLPSLSAAAADWRLQGATVTPEEACALKVAPEKSLVLRLGGWAIHAQPPMSQAIATLAALGIAELDVIEQRDDAVRDHMLIEAYKSASRDVVKIGDNDDLSQIASAMLDPATLRAARKAIGSRAFAGTTAGARRGETTQCAAADAEGRVCTLIHSLSGAFGSQIVSSRTGWIANDRGASFTDGANAPAPRRRPRNTLVGILATHEDGVCVAMGTPGAQAQTQTTFQIATNLLRTPTDFWGAVAAPRWSYLEGGSVAVEAAMGPERMRALENAGHSLSPQPDFSWQMGSIGLAAFDRGIATAVADPRREALALGL
jgi:gamma-glutamyltranspeptidase / glutathione hydrolase